ncbi:MAG: hypothetical protein ABSB86_02145 [Bryobacteraceae bacterium]|jgi:hypothetical protein
MTWLQNGRGSLSIPIIVAIAAAVALLVLGIVVLIRLRQGPKDKEVRRRLSVNLHGRLGDATVTEVLDDTLYYSYSVGGVSYVASQDISQLRQMLPPDPNRLIGRPASLKYSPQNPANSILVCEDWSGLRPRPPAPST